MKHTQNKVNKNKVNKNSRPKTTLAYKYMLAYERANTNFHRDMIAREIQRKIKDKRLNADNVRFLRHIVNYHVRNTRGIPGHRPTVHTMRWMGPGMRSTVKVPSHKY